MVDLDEPCRFPNITLAASGIETRTAEQKRKLERYRTLLSKLRARKTECSRNFYVEDPAAVPNPVPGNNVAPFLTACSNDKSYLELFKCSLAGHAEGWPSDTLENLVLVMQRLSQDLPQCRH